MWCKGFIWPPSQHLGIARLISEHYVIITKCQMPEDAIIIAIDKMSIACGCYQLRNLVKIARIHKSSSKEPQWRFKAELPPPEINALVSFVLWQRHNAFRSPRLQTFRRRSHSTVASQWDGNTAFTVHVAWYCTSLAIRAAIKSCLNMLLHNNGSDVEEKFWALMMWQTPRWNGLMRFSENFRRGQIVWFQESSTIWFGSPPLKAQNNKICYEFLGVWPFWPLGLHL